MAEDGHLPMRKNASLGAACKKRREIDDDSGCTFDPVADRCISGMAIQPRLGILSKRRIGLDRADPCDSVVAARCLARWLVSGGTLLRSGESVVRPAPQVRVVRRFGPAMELRDGCTEPFLFAARAGLRPGDFVCDAFCQQASPQRIAAG